MAVVCYFGTFEADYDRNRILRAGLRENGVEVLVCHEPLLEARTHKTGLLSSPRAALGLAARVAGAYRALAARYLALPGHDAVVVGYLGHLDVLVAAPLAAARGKPLVFDAFISLYDTLVHDRRILAEGSLGARAVLALDRLACALPDLVLVDTEAHAAYFRDRLGVPAARLRPILVGADPDRYGPAPRPAREAGAPFTVLHYAKFAPLHGLRTILEAAADLRTDGDVRLVLVGGGQLEDEVAAWIEELGLGEPAFTWRRWMDPRELRRAIAAADACLGIFGGTAKAGRVIPNKIFQCLAGGAAIVTRDSPAIRELLTDGEDVLLVPPEDPVALAAALRRLRDDPALRGRLGAAARARYLAECTPKALGAALLEAIAAIGSGRSGARRGPHPA